MALPVIIKRDIDRRAYEVYVTDALKDIIGTNERYADWVFGGAAPQDNRTGDEIDRELCEKFGWR